MSLSDAYRHICVIFLIDDCYTKAQPTVGTVTTWQIMLCCIRKQAK